MEVAHRVLMRERGLQPALMQERISSNEAVVMPPVPLADSAVDSIRQTFVSVHLQQFSNSYLSLCSDRRQTTTVLTSNDLSLTSQTTTTFQNIELNAVAVPYIRPHKVQITLPLLYPLHRFLSRVPNETIVHTWMTQSKMTTRWKNRCFRHLLHG
jgi:hypothetical protein